MPDKSAAGLLAELEVANAKLDQAQAQRDRLIPLVMDALREQGIDWTQLTAQGSAAKSPNRAPKRGTSAVTVTQAVRDKVLQCIKDNGPAGNTNALQATVGADAGTVKAALDELIAEGKLAAEGQGRGRKYKSA